MAGVSFDCEDPFVNVTKQYPNGFEAVTDLSLEIDDGEFLVMVGPSGCGKSTTLRMIAGLEEITEGEIRIGDRIVNDVHPEDRDIAVVFQNYALYPHMTVADNIGFALKLAKRPKDEIKKRVEDAAKLLDDVNSHGEGFFGLGEGLLILPPAGATVQDADGPKGPPGSACTRRASRLAAYPEGPAHRTTQMPPSTRPRGDRR